MLEAESKSHKKNLRNHNSEREHLKPWHCMDRLEIFFWVMQTSRNAAKKSTNHYKTKKPTLEKYSKPTD